MLGLRARSRAQHLRMLAVAVLALLIEAIIPAGWMLSSSRVTFLEVTVCSQGKLGAHTVRLAVPHEKPAGDGSDPVQSAGRCAFSILAGAGMVGGGPLVPFPSKIFQIPSAVPSVRFALQCIAFLRPPLRGPPAGRHRTTHAGVAG